MRARYYVPSISRFITKDPIGLAGGLNLYNYIDSNPINNVDPSGLIVPGDPDPTDEILIVELLRRIPWNKVVQVIKETLKSPGTKQIIRKIIYNGKTIAVLHEIWKKICDKWVLVHRDLAGSIKVAVDLLKRFFEQQKWINNI